MQLRTGWLLLPFAVLVLVVTWLLARPAPIAVDVATVTRGNLRVSVEEEGEVRAHDRYMVTAPVAGRLLRVSLHEGDAVNAGDVVATLTPLPLSSWQRDELQSRLAAAIARQQESRADAARAQLVMEQAERERARYEALLTQNLVAAQQAEDARAEARAAAQLAQAARQRLLAAEADVAATRASLAATDSSGRIAPVQLIAPVKDFVLAVIEQSERVVNSGAPLLLLGDPGKLEAVLELLSTDAVNVRAGMMVELFGWGGTAELRGRVRVVEPSAFTRVSTLGVEEQRVKVIVDIEQPPATLGDGYHIEARIVLADISDALLLPVGALFRLQDQPARDAMDEGVSSAAMVDTATADISMTDSSTTHAAAEVTPTDQVSGAWACFVLSGDTVELRHLDIGARNRDVVQVISGLQAGDRVVIYPPSDLQEGRRVSVRQP